MNWLENLTIEDLPESYQEMACIIGLENTLKLSEHYGKQSLYFRSLDELIAEKKRRFILDKFTGANHAELARATEYSERWVYEVLKNARDEKQPALL
ncbi:MAG: hypothetical protein EPN22_16920 [Nitrospirae bacterium]|nr:MAG: hypothetical protein EPN22_16920 [Nitrospirota bacterium]